MALGANRPILLALQSRRATMASVGLAFARADWTGQGQASWVEQSYASRVTGRPIRSFRLPEPTESIGGIVAAAFSRPLGGVCVTAPARGATARRATTAADGSFELSNLPHARYRLVHGAARLNKCCRYARPVYHAGVAIDAEDALAR